MAKTAEIYGTREEWIEANPLRRWRAENGAPQTEIALLVGVTEDTVRHWEHGRRYPSPESMAALTRVTGEEHLPTAWSAWWAHKKEFKVQWL